MNFLSRLFRARAASLRFEDVRQYLASRGWQPDANESRPGVGVYRYPTEPDAEVLLPLRRDWSDYAQRMTEAVQTVAAVEQRPIDEVLRDLAATPGDVLRVWTASPDTVGSLPLEEGSKLIQGARDLLLAAACSAERPRAFFPRGGSVTAREFVSRCRLGQGEEGNFTVTILVPVPPALPFGGVPSELGNGAADEPSERRVTMTLMRSLQVVQAALESGRPHDILAGVPQGVSANLCQALVAMTPSTPQGSLEVRMAWSRLRPVAGPPVPDRVSFAQGEFSLIGEAGRQLRQRTAASTRVEGIVIGLHASPEQPFAPVQGSVTLTALVGGQPARVRLALAATDYARACDAHRARLRVAVTGLLQGAARGQGFDLLQPAGFQILTAEPTAP
jgi:hypothetical protein